MSGCIGRARKHAATLSLAAFLLAASGSFDAGRVLHAQTPPNFRAAVDVIPVDVQVVDRTGRPVTGLTASQFDVTINGRARRVVSVDLVDSRVSGPAADASAAVNTTTTSSAGAAVQIGATPPARRIYILAIDCSTFDESTARPVILAAAEFIRQLQPQDEVGLFAYPIGPKIDPTTDHAAVIRGLDTIMARRDAPPTGEFHLAPSDVVELSRVPQTGEATALLAAFCGRPEPDGLCVERLTQEVRHHVLLYEGIGYNSIATLRGLLLELGKIDERKTVVLVSGGFVSADIPGGRPDNAQLGTDVGRTAAESNVNIYTLFIDQLWLQQMAAESLRPRSTPNAQRNSAIVGRWLDQFSSASGGSLLRVSAGNGAIAFDRVLTETSAYYLLGVEPSPQDRDGRPHELRVRVRQRDVSVRGRSWVVVPRPGDVPRVSIARGPAAAPAAPAPAALPPATPVVRALADAFDRDDRSAVTAALAPRDAYALIRAFRENQSPWPDSPRRTAAFALDLAMAGVRTDSPFTRDEALRLLAEYLVRVRAPAEGAAFECTWLWTVSAGVQGLFSPDLGALVTERAIERCPADANITLALAVVRDQQLMLSGAAGWPSQTSGAGMSELERRAANAYAAAAEFPDVRDEARIRAAYLHFRGRRYTEALAMLDAMGPPVDLQLRYLRNLFRGEALRAMGRPDEALAAFRAATATWPGAQSARVALMTLLIARGETEESAVLAETVLTAPATDADPWWLYHLGDYRAYSIVRARLRELIP